MNNEWIQYVKQNDDMIITVRTVLYKLVVVSRVVLVVSSESNITVQYHSSSYKKAAALLAILARWHLMTHDFFNARLRSGGQGTPDKQSTGTLNFS